MQAMLARGGGRATARVLEQDAFTGQAMKSILQNVFHCLRSLMGDGGNQNGQEDQLTRQTSRIAMPEFERSRDRYADEDPYPGSSKYLDLDKWLDVAIKRAQHLGLPGKHGLDLLDIGTGAGYFPFVCRDYGHNCLGLDVPDIAMYNELIDLLDVERRNWRIQPFVPLPQLGRRFDLVTAFSICFNGHGTDNLWGQEEWGFFLNDVRSNHLIETGAIYLELNREPDGEFYTEKLRRFFQTHGALVDGKKVLLKTEGCEILDGVAD
jgi:hypothetical protein